MTPGERQATALLRAVPRLFGDGSSERWSQPLAGGQDVPFSRVECKLFLIQLKRLFIVTVPRRAA